MAPIARSRSQSERHPLAFRTAIQYHSFQTSHTSSIVDRKLSSIYEVKFLLRSESPRDYIDMLRSMKHRPNVLLCDMTHMVAVEGNRFHEDFFCPFEGCVVESTVGNMETAKPGDRSVSFSFLLDNKAEGQQTSYWTTNSRRTKHRLKPPPCKRK